MTEEKIYEIKDDDENINFTGEHQLDDTDDINRTNISDSNRRSILQNQNGGHYQSQHTASSWAYNNQTCTLLLPGSLVYKFSSFQDFIKCLCQQICIGGTTIQQCKRCNFFKGARMLVNINVFFCFTGTTASICVNTLVRHCNVNELNATSASL